MRLQPPARVWTPSGDHPIDDVWKLEAVHEGMCVELRNERTHQVVPLSPDHIHHFTSSPINERTSFAGWLEINVSIDLSDSNPKVTPIPSGAARTIPSSIQPPLRMRLSAILDTINPAICANAKQGMSLPVMISDHNLRDLMKLRQEAGFDDLLSIHSNGNVAMGNGASIGGHINDLDQVGVRHGFVLQFRQW